MGNNANDAILSFGRDLVLGGKARKRADHRLSPGTSNP